MDPRLDCCIAAGKDGDGDFSRPDKPIPKVPTDRQPPPSPWAIPESLTLWCDRVVRFLIRPLLAGVGIALPISALASCVFYDAEWPERCLYGVCLVFFFVAMSVLVGTCVFLAVVVITGAGRCVWGLILLAIGLSARKPAPARRKGGSAPGESAVWDRWLDGM